ncbi:A24 family peptidase [Streptomyces millisiae]|uniref:A24 family peptidase n=1 Tax=Streptomyces millisiae TaxID=3075542 RepID=A0ABU2LTP9_9ACTN|nr:A24 family peptidase [Streptomyces sp. DSM 44918]MDT0320980.1 A24 family peptidase [Streptomyces sp. DSM 44918]
MGFRIRILTYARPVHPLLIVAAGGYGALVGALLARPVYRFAVPAGEPWRDTCPAGHRLTGRVAAGWLGVGRCAGCPPTAARPGAATGTALATAGCCAALAAAVGSRPELVVWLLAAPVMVLLATVDLAVQRLPDPLTLPLAGGLLVGLGVAAPLPGAGGSWPGALLGGLALGACYLLLFVINPNGMGFGDVKLALSVGVALGWYGWPAVLAGTFVGFLLAAGYGTALVIAGRAGRRTAVPFGPFMALGALAGLTLAGLAS